MNRLYRAGLIASPAENAPLPPLENFRPYEAGNPRAAAVECLRAFFREHKPREAGVLNIGVFSEFGPRHDNGMPVVLNVFALAFAPAVEQPAGEAESERVPCEA